MRAADLDIRELLEFDSDGGVIRFGGQRALILDAVAMGLLRQQLITTVGVAGARGILTRFGWAHGFRTAETVKDQFPWDSEHEWQVAGGRLHRLQGLVRFEPVVAREAGTPRPFAEAVWHDSYEAEQHLLHLGRADEAVCWSLCGFASGYLSRVTGRDIICIEQRCRGKGDAVCTMIGRPREEWDASMADELGFFSRDCLSEGYKQVAEALKVTERKLRSRRKELARATGAGEPAGLPAGLVVRSEAMRRVIELARRVAQVDSTALVTGESGVGKEVLARLIHDESARGAGPFVAVNCGAVPEGLLESELFGHARGAFTGATQDRAGLFEAAQGGTLFLDEIGDVPPAMQVKLLRALQQHEVRRVGENKNRPVDARVVAATNRDLAADVKAGRFRQDLYYRLRVIELKVPPLRERTADILPMARAFLEQVGRRIGRRDASLSPEAGSRLLRYAWPGNVRELENVIEQSLVLSSGTRIEDEDLPEEIRSTPPTPFQPGEVRPLDAVERDYILSVLAQASGNKARAAAQLGIGTATLFRKLKQYSTVARPARTSARSRARQT